MKTILCIVRASTVQQETQSQKDELVEFCRTKGFEPEQMEFIEVAGASARKCNPEYLKMLADIKNVILSNPDIKNVALWHLNRLGRVESKLHEMKEFFVKNRIQVYIKEPAITLLDDNGEISAAGSITFSVYASMVKYETDEMFAKMKRGRLRNKSKGMYIGGNLKFGYSIAEGKLMVVNPEEAATVKLVFELYSTSKYTLPELAEELNQRGLKKNGHTFDYFSVLRILRDRSYAENDFMREPLVSVELYEKCKQIREEKCCCHVPTKEFRHVNLAVGILKCTCGLNYIANGPAYRCYGKIRNKKVQCNSVGIRVDVIDTILILLARYSALKELMTDNSESTKDIEDKIEVIKQKINNCEVEKSKLLARKERLQDDYYVEANMSEAMYQKRLTAIDGKVTANQKLIESFQVELKNLKLKLQNLGAVTAAEKMLFSIWELNWNMTDTAVRKQVKNIIAENISEIRLKEVEVEGRKQKDILITVYHRNGQILEFRYSVYLKNFSESKCPIFMNVGNNVFKPILRPISHPIFSGNTEYNPDVLDVIQAKYDIPDVTMAEFQKALDSYYKN